MPVAGPLAPPPAPPGIAPPPWQPGPSGSGGGGHAHRPVAGGEPPELVVTSCVLLLVAAATAIWVGLTMFTVSASALGSGGGGITWRGLLVLTNGIGDVALAYFVRRGDNPARIVATVVCAGWALYWLINTSKASDAFGRLSGALPGLTGVGMMATLGLLLLTAWALVTGGLLWTPQANEHFSA
jgi:hypothetical protein